MTLSEEDGELFYKLWFPLLNYVNEKKKVHPNIGEIKKSDTLVPMEVKDVANALWSETSLIDTYLDDHMEIEGDERDILSSWKRCVSGRFALERHLRKGSVLIYLEKEEVYQVSGIMSSWEEMFFFARLPIVLEATLIPFRSVIIPDGLLVPYNIRIGPNLAKSFKDMYMRAKKSGNFHKSL